MGGSDLSSKLEMVVDRSLQSWPLFAYPPLWFTAQARSSPTLLAEAYPR